MKPFARLAGALFFAGGIGACWLTSSFDSLVAGPAIDAATDADAEADAEAGDADAAPSTCITADYFHSVMADAPLAYYRLDEAAPARTAKDASGHGNDGAYASTGVTLGSPGALKSDADTAATFDGVAGFVNIGAGKLPFLGKAPFTLEAWINPSTLDGAYRGVTSNESPSTTNRQGYLLYVHAPMTAMSSVGFERWENGASNPTIANDAVAVGRWSHVVGAFDGAKLVLYVDGVARDSYTGATNSIEQASTLVVGALNSAAQPTFFAGALDEVAIYDHALSARCVTAHYHLGIGEPP